MDIKEEVSEESSFPDFCSENERDVFIKDLGKQIKIETVKGSNDIKPELEDSTCSQNEEHNLLRFTEAINKSEIETKLDIMEEEWLLEREELIVRDDIKDEIHENFSIKPPRLCAEATSGDSCCKSALSSANVSGTDITFNEGKDHHDCEKYERDVTKMPTEEYILSKQFGKRDEGKMYIAPLCLKQNKFTPAGKKAYPCNICNKSFTQLSYLKVHYLVHEGKKPHQCKTCGKSFIRLSFLKKHTLIHVGKKQHQCKICYKSFALLSYLKTHSLTHEGKKPHRRKICNRSFKQRSHLKAHALLHDSKKSPTFQIMHRSNFW